MDASPPIDASPPMDDDYPHGFPHPYYGAGDNSNGQPIANRGLTLGSTFMVVFTVCLILSFICVYARLRRRQPRRRFLSGRTNISRRRGFLFAREDPLNVCNVGLDARVLESLPLFAYKAQGYKDALECAVCLLEFEENEKARLLPNCKHSFHVDCIDMWFHSHSTCPICRTAAQPRQRGGDNNTDEISINIELISSGNRQSAIGPGLEQGGTRSQGAKTAVDEGPSTSGISSMSETAIDMPGMSESFSSEKQAFLNSGSQSSKIAFQ